MSTAVAATVPTAAASASASASSSSPAGRHAVPPRARFNAAVLQRFAPLAYTSMDRVLDMLKTERPRQRDLDAAVAAVPHELYKELIDRAMCLTVRACAVRLTNPKVDVIRIVNNLIAIVFAVHMEDDDDDIWHYFACSLFGYMLTIACEIDEAIWSEEADYEVSDEDPPDDAEEAWTALSQMHIQHFVALVVDKIAIDADFVRSHQLTWAYLYAKFPRMVPRSAHDPFVNKPRFRRVCRRTMSDEFKRTLAHTWDECIRQLDFWAEREGVAAQYILARPPAAKLPAALAAHVAGFIAPIAAPELTRMLAVYTASVDRHRARRMSSSQQQAADERHAQLTHAHATVDAASIQARDARDEAHSAEVQRIFDFLSFRRVLDAGDAQERMGDLTDFDTSDHEAENDDESEDESAQSRPRISVAKFKRMASNPSEPVNRIGALLQLAHTPADIEGLSANIDEAMRLVAPLFFQELVDRTIVTAIGIMRDDVVRGNGIGDRHVALLGRVIANLHIDNDERVWFSIACGLFRCMLGAMEYILGMVMGKMRAECARAGTQCTSAQQQEPMVRTRAFVARVHATIIQGVFRANMRDPDHCMRRFTWHHLQAALCTSIRHAEPDGYDSDSNWHCEEEQPPPAPQQRFAKPPSVKQMDFVVHRMSGMHWAMMRQRWDARVHDATR